MTKVEHYCICGRKLTHKEFLTLERKARLENTVPRKDLLKSKKFTKRQLEKLVKAKVLRPIKYRSKIYLKKDEVTQGIKYFEELPKLF